MTRNPDTGDSEIKAREHGFEHGSTPKKALVAGALGVSGRALVNHLVALGDWEIIGVSRRKPEFQTPARYLAIDLLDRADLDQHSEELADVTHLFFAALQPRNNFFAEVEPNLRMLQHTVEAVGAFFDALPEDRSDRRREILRRHLGPYKTPAKEDDPRHIPPNFYYDQEDYLKAHCSGKDWSWTALRPSCICGFAVGNPMNMATVIAVYATLCRELGLPLRYPGSTRAYGMLMEMTDAELLAKAMVWAGENECCDGEAFNITNGDFNRWENIWPRLAEFLNMPYAPPQRIPLTQFMSDKETALASHRSQIQSPGVSVSRCGCLAVR